MKPAIGVLTQRIREEFGEAPVNVPLAVKQLMNPATSLSSATLYAFRIAASFAVM